MEPIQTLMMMLLHWKFIFNFITMKLTFTSLYFFFPLYVPSFFGPCVKTFLFSFFFLTLWQLLITFFFRAVLVQDAASAALFIGRKRFICTTWWKWLYRIMNSSLVLGFILSHFCFLNWFFFFCKIRLSFYLQLGVESYWK